MNCPHCGHEILHRRHRDIKGSIIDAVKQYGPVSATQIAAMIYDRTGEFERRNIIVHISQINASRGRIISNSGRGMTHVGYRYVGPE